MRSLKLTIALIAIAGVAVSATHLSTAAEPKSPVAYFLDQTSNDADVPIDLPADAKDGLGSFCATP